MTPRLSLGPILYYWPRNQVLDFYAQMAESPVALVYLGETVCAKRHQMRTDDWLHLAEQLAAAGKEVVLSTLALVEAESDLKRLRRLCGNGRFWVEANDMAAVRLCQGQPFVAGPGINLYNGRALALLAREGLRRWVLPLELSHQTLAEMQALRPAGVETEVFAYGRLPLAYSARCFTARAYNLPKDDCQYRCLDTPDGMTLTTQDDTRFLALNGIQTQSAHTFSLLGELKRLRALAVDVIRISPQGSHTGQVIGLFDDCLRGGLDPAEGAARLKKLMPVGPCDGYWHGDAGMTWRAAVARLA
ncbi:MAG: U32 family peptidase [Pseudomonadota bacterium]